MFSQSAWAIGYNLFGYWQSNAPYKLVFTSGAQTINTWACTPVTITREDYMGRPSNWGTSTNVNLSGSNMTYYSDSTCDTVISSVTIPAGQSAVTVYFNFWTNGSISANAGATGLVSGSQTQTVSLDPYTWVGGASCSPANWSTGACWKGGAAPGATNRAIFDGNCTTNCSPTLDVNVSIGALAMEPPYGGTLTQGAFTFQTGNSASFAHSFYMAAGTFLGGSVAISVHKDFEIEGGVFTSTSGTLSVAGNFTVEGSPTFNHNGGTVSFGTGSNSFDIISTVTPGTFSFNNVTFNRATTANLTLSGTLTVLGNLALSNAFQVSENGGTINVSGNLSITHNFGGTTVINMVGTSPQTISSAGSVAAANVLPIVINSPGGVTLDPANTIVFGGGWTWTSGTVTATGSTVNFNTGTITDSNTQFNNVIFGTAGATVSGTMTVLGNLTNSGILSGGTISVAGNVASSGTAGGGGATIVLNGSSNQTISGVAGAYLPNITINNTGGVTLGSIVNVDRNWTWTAGAVTATGSTVSFGNSNNATTINDTTTQFNNIVFTKSQNQQTSVTGTMTVLGNLTFSTGGQINNGGINLSGNLSATKGNGGNTVINMIGPSAQTITGGQGFSFSAIKINNPAGVTISGTISLGNAWTWTAGPVTTTGSTVAFEGGPATTFNDSNTQFNNVVFQKGSGATFTISGTLSVLGTTTLNMNGNFFGTNAGTIIAYGDVSVLSNNPNNGLILSLRNASGGQTVTDASGFSMPGINVNAPGGVTLSGTVQVRGNWTWTAGTVTTTGTTVGFTNSGTINDSNTQFNNVTFQSGANQTITGTVNVGGNLILNQTSTMNGGTVAVAGNVTLSNNGGGTAGLTFNGSGAQTYTATLGSLPTGTITVNKPAGTLTLASAMSAAGATQNFTIASGSMDMAGFALTVGNVLTLNTGTTLTQNAGTLTYGSLVNNGTINP